MLKALLTDVDGTITDTGRAVSTGAIDAMRALIARGVEVVLASGNTACFMDALSRIVGTNGTLIGENGGVYRIGFFGDLHVTGQKSVSLEALGIVENYYRSRGVGLQLYSPQYRFSDVAFARTVPADEVRAILSGHNVQVLDTGFAIHLQEQGVNKGRALLDLARDMGLSPKDFLAIGDGVNDVETIRAAGIGIAVGNAHQLAKDAADYVTEKTYGDGFIEAIEKYSSYFLER
ncbi:MAG TPA: phosphoglycolate phosphatase [Methanoregulaceae archaeon]|nr:phosphoglycolate phosphatase [Methanoregulaceae archaeon]